MTVKEFEDAINQIPKFETNDVVGTIYSIDVDELKETIKRFEKVPSFDELQRENNELVRKNEEIIKYLKEKIKKCKETEEFTKKISINGRNNGKTLINTIILENNIMKECFEDILKKFEGGTR